MSRRLKVKVDESICAYSRCKRRFFRQWTTNAKKYCSALCSRRKQRKVSLIPGECYTAICPNCKKNFSGVVRRAGNRSVRRFCSAACQKRALAYRNYRNEDGTKFYHWDFLRLFESQAGQCLSSACGHRKLTLTPYRSNSVHVDHDHKTGVVRGLLCHRCNVWLGVYEIMAPFASSYLDGREVAPESG